MVKKNVLTPVLAGVLGVTVAGSGVLYLLDNKSAKTSDEKGGADAKDKVGETAFSRVQDKVESTAEKVEQAFKGELDFAYNGKAEITFGPAVTDQFGFVPKPFSIEAKTKQKGGVSEAQIAAAYDSKALATLSFVADSNSGKVYIKVPELSSAYLTATQEELEKLLENSQQIMGGVTPGNMTALNISAMQQNPDMDQIMELLEQVDMDALLEDFADYIELIEKNIPEGKDSGKLEGDINGNSYSYTVKTYDITGQVIVDMIDTVTAKAKDDKVLKDTFDKLGVGESYDQLISSFSTSLKQGSAQTDLSKTLFTVDIYYDGDDATGLRFDVPGQAGIKMVAINTSDVLGVDLSVSAEGSDVLTLKGAFKDTDGAVNGDMTLSAVNEGSNAEFKLTVKDLKEQGELFSGSIKAEIKSGDENVAFDVDSASTADKLDISFKLSANSQEGFTVKLTGEKSDATDVSIPTGEAFPLDENGIKSYMDSIDKDKFMSDLKTKLGDDLWNMMFGE